MECRNRKSGFRNRAVRVRRGGKMFEYLGIMFDGPVVRDENSFSVHSSDGKVTMSIRGEIGGTLFTVMNSSTGKTGSLMFEKEVWALATAVAAGEVEWREQEGRRLGKVVYRGKHENDTSVEMRRFSSGVCRFTSERNIRMDVGGGVYESVPTNCKGFFYTFPFDFLEEIRKGFAPRGGLSPG